jgi:hypothetical protein
MNNLNIDLNQIFIIIGAILLAIIVYNQLINISSMLVIPLGCKPSGLDLPSKKLKVKVNQLNQCSNCNI